MSGKFYAKNPEVFDRRSFCRAFPFSRFLIQRMVFAFITVVITVHAYVFYSVYVVNGDDLRTIGGIYMFGRVMPVWSVVLVEFCFLSSPLCAPCSR